MVIQYPEVISSLNFERKKLFTVTPSNGNLLRSRRLGSSRKTRGEVGGGGSALRDELKRRLRRRLL